jgi:hypothetical protein
MKIIPKFYHGVLDYLSGLLLLGAPNLLGFGHAGGTAAWIPRIVGLLIAFRSVPALAATVSGQLSAAGIGFDYAFEGGPLWAL